MKTLVLIGYILCSFSYVCFAGESLDSVLQKKLQSAKNVGGTSFALSSDVFFLREAKDLCSYAVEKKSQCEAAAIQSKDNDLQKLCAFAADARGSDCESSAKNGSEAYQATLKQCDGSAEEKIKNSQYAAGGFSAMVKHMGIMDEQRKQRQCGRIVLKGSDDREKLRNAPAQLGRDSEKAGALE